MIKRLFILLLLLPFALAQTIPVNPQGQCDQVTLMNKIQQESQATRKFVLDTFEQKSAIFFTEADRRLTLLDNEAHAVINEAVYKLGFIWGGITLTIVSFYSLLSLAFKRRAYRKLKKDILEDLQREIRPQQIAPALQPQQYSPQPVIELTEEQKQAMRENALRQKMKGFAIPVGVKASQ